MTGLPGQTCRQRLGRALGLAAVGLGCSLASHPALAQSEIQPLLDPVVLPDYGRNRNVSVTETPHPDYGPLGIDVAGFQVFPSLTTTAQVNSNIFFNDFDKHADVAQFIQPAVFVTSNGSFGLLQFYATDQIRRDLNYVSFDKNTWSAHVNGRIDVTDALSVNALVQVGHFIENPYSSVVDANVAVLSQFDQTTASLKGVWTQGHVRVSGDYDHFSVQYAPLGQASGSQAYRDNHDDRGVTRAEYSLSPSLAMYSQVSFDSIRYRHPGAFGAFSRNSTGAAFVSGLSLDWSGVARGAVGLGYSRRDYAGNGPSGALANPSGLSFQARIELFPSPSTTVTGSAYRLLRDANSGQSVAYYDARLECDVDHALRQNVIVSTRLYYGGQDFVEDPRRRTFYRGSFAAKMKFDRNFNANFDLGYSKSTTNGSAAGAPFGQFIGSIALQYRI